MRRLLLPLTLVVIVLAAAACGDDGTTVGSGGTAGGDPGGSGEDSIAGEYRSVEVTENGQPRPLVGDSVIALRFDDGQLGVSAGCNSMSGTYEIDDGVLVVAALATTEMGCEPALMDQDQWVAEFLGAGPEIAEMADGFDLITDTTTIHFVDREIVEPDAELTGTTWTVDGFVHGSGSDGAVSSVAGPAPVLRFEPEGFVTGSDGCNDFGYAGESGAEPTDGLRYEIDGDRITFSGGAVSTDMACPDVDTEHFWAVVDGTVTWEIEASRLTLTADDRGLVLRSDA